jgi:hypothetical protein
MNVTDITDDKPALDVAPDRWLDPIEAVEFARDLAARLEQELAETQRRCRALITEWTALGSMLHAAQLAEALELP